MSIHTNIDGSKLCRYPVPTTYETKENRVKWALTMTFEHRQVYENDQIVYEYELLTVQKGCAQFALTIADQVQISKDHFEEVDQDKTLGWRLRQYLMINERGSHTSIDDWYALKNGKWYYRSQHKIVEVPF